MNMPRAFIQYKDGIPAMESLYKAQAGFEALDFNIVPFEGLAAPEDAYRDDIVCGYVSTVKGHLRKKGIVAEELNYPKELMRFLGRGVFQVEASYIYNEPAEWPVFIKPIGHKRWDGRVVHFAKDFSPLMEMDEMLQCAQPMKMVSEHRCFVRYGTVIATKHYRGSPYIVPNVGTIEAMVKEYTDAPAAYSLDVCVADRLHKPYSTHLVEVNDGYSLGTYGIDSKDYAKFLYARWAQLLDIPDICL